MFFLKRYIIAMAIAVCAFSVNAEPVDINTADVKQLAAAISGIGPKKAQLIIDYRTANGMFATVDELTKVKGIGKKTVEKNRDNLLVSKSGKDATQ